MDQSRIQSGVVEPNGWLLIVDDPLSLSGSSAASVISFLASRTRSTSVVVRDLEAGGPTLPKIRTGPVDGRAFRPVEITELVEQLVQIDWGDFFFFSNRESMEAFTANTSIKDGVGIADVVLRCVDDGYFYFYGTDLRLFDDLKGAYPDCETTRAPIVELAFPY